MPGKLPTPVDDMPLEQALCRGLTGHQWNWAAHRADRVGRNVVIYLPCSQCFKVASLLLNMSGTQLRPRRYIDPDGWVHDKTLNTVSGRAAMRSKIIPHLHYEEASS